MPFVKMSNTIDLRDQKTGGRTMNPIVVNEEKCVGCELCVKDCPSGYLRIEDGKAHTKTRGCLECGHCYAICPQGAITMANYDCMDEAVVRMTEIPARKYLKREDTVLPEAMPRTFPMLSSAAGRRMLRLSVLTSSVREQAFREESLL